MSTTSKYQPNNYVVLTGNTGAEAQERTGKKTGKSFVTLTLYTANVHIDKQGNKNEYPSTPHAIVAHNPYVMKQLLAYKTGTRLRIEGKLSYRTFEVMGDDGEVIKKREVLIIAKKVETAVLPSKQEQEPQVLQTVNA